jgi:hypothetical protein
MKQETLEEAAENYGWKIKRNPFSDRVKANELADSAKQDFIAGANWQAERVYSLEDMIATFHYGHQIGMNNVLAIQSQHSPQPIPKPDLDSLKKEWFEQFKKK